MARSSIKSSRSIDNGILSISERRSSPCFSTISFNSWIKISSRRDLEEMISWRSAILIFNSLYSFVTFSTSSLLNWYKRRSAIAFAWGSVKSNAAIPGIVSVPFKTASNCSRLELALPTAITSSIRSWAFTRPSKMWARASAFSSSNCARRSTTDSLCST